MSSSYPELTFSDLEEFNADRLNKAMAVIDTRLRSLEPFTPQWEAAVNELRLFGLARLNETILPAYERVRQLADFGFLIAQSSTSLTMVQDDQSTFVITEGNQRDLFTPTPFLVITRDDNATDYAVARLVSYDVETGQLVVTIKNINGGAGPFTDWWIGPLAGNALSALSYLEQITAAKDLAVAAKNTAIEKAGQTANDRESTAANLAAAITAKNQALQAAANAALFDATNFISKSQSGTFSGAISFGQSPTAPTAADGDNTTKVATTAFVRAAVAALVGSTPSALDTLQEIASALGNDANFATTMAAALGLRVRVDSAQGLTSGQKAQARSNIDAPAVSDLTPKADLASADFTVLKRAGREIYGPQVVSTTGGTETVFTTSMTERLGVDFTATGLNLMVHANVTINCPVASGAVSDATVRIRLTDTVAGSDIAIASNVQGIYNGIKQIVGMSLTATNLTIGRVYRLAIDVQKDGNLVTYYPINMRIDGLNL